MHTLIVSTHPYKRVHKENDLNAFLPLSVSYKNRVRKMRLNNFLYAYIYETLYEFVWLDPYSLIKISQVYIYSTVKCTNMHNKVSLAKMNESHIRLNIGQIFLMLRVSKIFLE